MEYEASGLTQQEFGSRHGVALKTLARYVARHRRQRANEGLPLQLVPVEVGASQARASELVVLLSRGQRIEVRQGFDAATLKQLIAVLEQH